MSKIKIGLVIGSDTAELHKPSAMKDCFSEARDILRLMSGIAQFCSILLHEGDY